MYKEFWKQANNDKQYLVILALILNDIEGVGGCHNITVEGFCYKDNEGVTQLKFTRESPGSCMVKGSVVALTQTMVESQPIIIKL